MRGSRTRANREVSGLDAPSRHMMVRQARLGKPRATCLTERGRCLLLRRISFGGRPREGLFRHFKNRRQVAAYAGLAPTPWQSGSIDREQGVSKSGNPRLRTTLIQTAWLWLLHQPNTALARWFNERVQRNNGRMKKSTVLALARKLLVALWKYATSGVLIEGAIMKSA